MSDAEPIIAMIVAVAENGVIGRDGGMPWRIPSEMKHFRKTTMGKPLIMGRKTFDSLKKPLEGRDDIVVTHNRDHAPRGSIAAESVDHALKLARDCALARDTDEIMVIGGAQIYEAAMPYTKRLYLTWVHAEPEGDVKLPQMNMAEWIEKKRTFHKRQNGDEFDYTLCIYERR